jgi:butyrate kinase
LGSPKLYILTINPGSTSTKVAVFLNEKKILSSTISHTVREIARYPRIIDQRDFRTKIVLDFMKKNEMDMANLNAVAGRGGLLPPLKSGTYIVNREMVDYLSVTTAEHASNLGAIIAFSISEPLNIPAYIVDPVVVDEMDDTARITGIPEIKRVSIFHALNQKATAREAADSLGKKYEECNLIVAHLGGGISIGAHKQGAVVDVNNALDGEGPFSPERAGTIPTWSLVELATSGKYSLAELKQKITGKGGLVGHLGTNNLKEVARRIADGDKRAELIFTAMAYTAAKAIAALSAVFSGRIDAVVLTGGMAYHEELVDLVRQRIEFLAPILVFPGEDEMSALSKAVLHVLNGESQAKIWRFSGGKS